MSPTPDRTLDDLQQTIADLKRQLAESNVERDHLRSERDEALDQQTATTEVLQVINSSPGDLTPVFDAMLEKAMRLCEAACGQLYTYDGDRFHPIAVRGGPRFVEWWREKGPVRPLPDGPGPLGRVARGESIVGVDDFREDAAYRTVPGFRATVDASNTRSGVTVALRNDVALLGAITIYRQEVRPFTKKQIALLGNFAAQAVIAMENARLLTETREALEQQTATAEVLRVINSSPGDLAPVFDAMLDKAIRLCDARFGQLVTSADGEIFTVAAAQGPPAIVEFLRNRPPTRPGSGTSMDRLVRGERCVHIHDAMAEEAYRRGDPTRRALVDLGGCRTAVSVGLRKNDAIIGAISVYRSEVKPFSTTEIALVENFAAQAVIAIENARLITETREALEQQTATAEVLQVINSSPGDLAPVFDNMLAQATRLCEATYGHVRIYDGTRFHLAAVRGDPQLVALHRQRPAFEPGPHSPITRTVRGERIVHIPDAVASEHYRDDPPFRELADSGICRAMLLVALRKDDALLGFIAVYREEARPFSDRQIALLQNFAAQAVIAMENARLITETREALERQTATAEVLQVINSSPGDLAPVFDAMLDKAMRLCNAACGIICTYDGTLFHPGAARGSAGFVERVRRGGPFEAEAGFTFQRVVAGQRVVHIPDVLDTQAHRDKVHLQAVAEISRARSLLTVALAKEHQLLGTITVFREEVSPYSEREIALLQNFAAQAVIAMENARLITETREALEQQTATSEVLGVINSSPGDLAPVFDAMLERALGLCEASFGVLRTYDGEQLHLVAMRGVPDAYAEFAQAPITIVGGTAASRIRDGEDVVSVPDLSEDEGYRIGAPAPRALVHLGGARSYVAVALRKDAELLGTIGMYRQEVRPFTDKQIALLQNFAAQAVIAMENARLLDELHQRTDQVAELNRGLEARVAEQVEELGRVGRLKRFLAPQLAEMIVSQGDEKILESHRREIVVVFCDLRGYTAFTETAEPEEVLDFLRQYHGALGPLVSQFEGTLDQFSGDGIMVFFNDPVPCPDPAERAVKMAMAMREVAGTLIAAWRRRGRMLGFGAGIAQGYATLGQIGFADRSGYTAIGTVCNLAARLCAEAKDGQILIAQLVAVAVEETTPLEEVGELTLKGLTQPVVAYNVPLAASQPALRVIEGGPQSV